MEMSDEDSLEIGEALVYAHIPRSELSLCSFSAVDHDSVIVQFEKQR